MLIRKLYVKRKLFGKTARIRLIARSGRGANDRSRPRAAGFAFRTFGLGALFLHSAG
jgi:hypothetical protein